MTLDQKKLEELAAKLLQAAMRPKGWQPYMEEMLKVGQRTAEELRQDRYNPQPLLPIPEKSKVRVGTGWVEPRPLEPPPGINIIDRMVEHQNALDLAEKVEKLKPIAVRAAPIPGVTRPGVTRR
jgi:hypothetical protein